jgi:hypothetical protein
LLLETLHMISSGATRQHSAFEAWSSSVSTMDGRFSVRVAEMDEPEGLAPVQVHLKELGLADVYAGATVDQNPLETTSDDDAEFLNFLVAMQAEDEAEATAEPLSGRERRCEACAAHKLAYNGPFQRQLAPSSS